MAGRTIIQYTGMIEYRPHKRRGTVVTDRAVLVGRHMILWFTGTGLAIVAGSAVIRHTCMIIHSSSEVTWCMADITILRSYGYVIHMQTSGSSAMTGVTTNRG